ncbi:MAG: hypothetical protein GJU73_12560 [Ferrovum sp.]|jgi:hypothetical protein|uniref:hypothetical protein n=1 Tax=Ferrovum sp. TaxID=2609467 RepID=UPI00261E0DAC|nr:hypothetical protein [Ferrovum sp.]MBW8068255.1 hypothetical protein [Ferrovum sp.]
MNYYIQTGTNNIIIATCSTNETLGSPWISIPQTSLATAQQAGASWDTSTLTVVVPPANYNLAIVGQQRIAYLYGLLPALIAAPVAFTTAAGVSTSFHNTSLVQQFISRSLTVWDSTDWPSNFFILDVNNNPITLTYADTTGLAKALGNAELTIQHNFITAKNTIMGYVNGGGTVADINAVTL